MFLQEHWLPNYEAEKRLSGDFKEYLFTTTSSDMFQSAEECMIDTRPTWHGTAFGWFRHIDSKVTRVPKVDERFSGIMWIIYICFKKLPY